MSCKHVLRDLMAHLEWADATLWNAVLQCEKAAEDERLRFLLHHIHTVQTAFLGMWRGQTPTFPELASFESGASIAAWGRRTLGEVQAWLAHASDDELAAELTVPWAANLASRIGREPERATVGESVLQLAVHSAHHRGQAATRLAELGGAPPLNDYIYWVWCGRPHPGEDGA